MKGLETCLELLIVGLLKMALMCHVGRVRRRGGCRQAILGPYVGRRPGAPAQMTAAVAVDGEELSPDGEEPSPDRRHTTRNDDACAQSKTVFQVQAGSGRRGEDKKWAKAFAQVTRLEEQRRPREQVERAGQRRDAAADVGVPQRGECPRVAHDVAGPDDEVGEQAAADEVVHELGAPLVLARRE